MKGKITKSFLALALTATVTMGNLGMSIAMAENNNMISGASIDELLNNIPENSKKFLDTTAGSKLKLDEDVDLKSTNKIEVIVELKSDPNAIQRAKALKERAYTKVDIEAEHKTFKNAFPQTFSNEDSSVEFGLEFKEVFNGIVLTVSANEIEKIAEMDSVKTIWSNRVVQLDIPENQTDESAADEPSLLMHDSIPGIGVDKLHDEDIKGEGIKVGVLDTGVDYNHPDLKEAFKGGYDFVDNDDDPMETTYEDWKNSNKNEFNSDGAAYYTSHGTHVAGTILGRGENPGLDYAITGVAPKADLYSYRVLGPYGSGAIDGIIAAIEKSVEEGMDVINLSLGIGINDPYRPESIAVNNCMLYTNTVAVVAASNAGPNSFTLGSPGTASLGITVGANTSAMPLDTMDIVYGEKEYHLNTFAKTWTDKATDLLDKEYEIVHVGLGSTGEIKDKDLNGKIALIKRGTLSFVDKIANVKAAGAVGAIIYNNVDGPLNIYLGESDSFIRTFAMDQVSGEALLKDLAAGENQKISFANYEEIKTEADVLADFSSRGPVSGTIHIKPEITAPGVDILSTVPGYINDKDGYDNYDISYGRMSGTSMATPHVAGIVALMKEEHPDYTSQEVKSILMNTSEALNGDYSVFEVGAGRVNAFDAVKTEVNIQVMDTAQSINSEGQYVDVPDVTGDLSFGKIEKGVTIEKNLQIKINGEDDKDFTIRTEFTTSNFKPVENPDGENVTIGIPETFHAKAGTVNELNFSINVPEISANGTYEGYVIFTSGEEEYRLPFAALATGTYIMVENLNDMISLGEFHPYQAGPMIYTGFEVSEKFQKLDVLIQDGETNEYVGYIGSLLTDILPTNTYLEVGPLIGYGYYCPIFTDSNGKYYLDENVQKLSEDKRYVIQFRAIDKKGELFTGEDDYFIDSVGPKLTFEEDSQPGIYEIEYNPNKPEEIFYIDGTVYDDYVDYAKGFGYEISQASNGVGFLENMPSTWNQGILTLSTDGKLHAGYPTAQVNEE
ncbi:MAG: S8 family serine peptidase, partial [Clostridium sp.]